MEVQNADNAIGANMTDGLDEIDLPPAQQRLVNDSSLEPDLRVVPTTTDGYASSVDVYGVDVVDSGMSSTADVRGMGLDLDSLPGDETPIDRENLGAGPATGMTGGGITTVAGESTLADEEL